MVHRKGIIHCSCAKALHPAQAIQWDKCNLTRLSPNFTFEDFSWLLLRAIQNAVAGHMRPAGLQLDHTALCYEGALKMDPAYGAGMACSSPVCAVGQAATFAVNAALRWWAIAWQHRGWSFPWVKHRGWSFPLHPSIAEHEAGPQVPFL